MNSARENEVAMREQGRAMAQAAAGTLVVRRRQKIPAGQSTAAHSDGAASTVRRYQLSASHH